MRVIRTETEIEAPPEVVWAVLTDFAAYPSWNPFITEASGTLAVDEVLSLHMVPGDGRAQTFTPVVRAVREQVEVIWYSALKWSWLFSAEHRFGLSEVGGKTRFTQSEVYRGALVGLMRSTIDQTERDFRTMNAALKDRVEG